MSTRTLALALLLACPGLARAQCCLGAQDVAAESAGGRYRVQATSLTGTGFACHGPYRYRFQWSERDAATGQQRPGPAFELAFDTTAHFSMHLFVSPTGNGFLLSTSLTKVLAFRAPSGDTLVDLAGVQAAWYPRGEATPALEGFHVGLWSAVARPVPGGGEYDPAGSLFLPLGAPVAGALREQVLAALAATPAERATRDALARDLVVALGDEDFEVRERSAAALRALGPLALPALEAALAPTPGTGGTVDPLLRALLLGLAPWRAAGGLAALDDPLLLVGLLASTDAEVSDAARRRLEGLPGALPAGADAPAWRTWADARR